MLILTYTNEERNEVLKYLILVSHGQFAEGIKTSLEMFAGDAIKRCFALCLHNGDSAEDFTKKVTAFLQEEEFKKEDEFVVIADIIGANYFFKCLFRKGLSSKFCNNRRNELFNGTYRANLLRHYA